MHKSITHRVYVMYCLGGKTLPRLYMAFANKTKGKEEEVPKVPKNKNLITQNVFKPLKINYQYDTR